jgi:DNA repair protein RadC
MARRMKYEQVPIKTRIKSSQDAYLALVLMTNLDNLTHEEFWCMYLNRSNQVIKCIRISEGGISGTITDVRLIFNHAIKLLASGIILCHNHPSGNLSPSDADLKITKKIKDAGTLLDVSVLDHLIVSTEGFTSLADDNLI